MDGTASVVCSVHGGGQSAEEKVYQDMYQFTGMNNAQVKAATNGQVTYKNNSGLRSYLVNNVYGGSWPQMSASLLKKNNITGTYYIQPYYGSDVIVYANQYSTAVNNWNATMIFNRDDGKWYTGKTIGLSSEGKSWSNVWALMQKRGWRALTA